MQKVYWLNEAETEIIRGPEAWPKILGNISNPGIDEVRAAHGREVPSQPTFDATTHFVVGAIVVAGEIEWEIGAYSADEILQRDATNQDAAIAQVWQAATDYENAQISGSAVGLLTVGVLNGLPKAVLVQGWIATIWDLYYSRKTAIKAGEPFADYMIDFSACGEIPHSVPELRVEIGM